MVAERSLFDLVESRCIVAITLPMHRLSCVAASAPPQAQLVAELTLEVAWDNRHVGLTFGAAENPALNSGVHAHVDLEGGRPPQCLEAAGDATWGAGFEQLEDLPPLASLAQTDELGREVIRRLTNRGLDVSNVQVDDTGIPTGFVVVTMEGAMPSYDIVQPSAWDAMAVTDDVIKAATGAVLVYGSLAQRD